MRSQQVSEGVASESSDVESPSNSASEMAPTMKDEKRKRGRPVKGTSQGIDQNPGLLDAEGSTRAKKRRATDAAMAPDEAALKRAQNSDRSAKSQALKKLRKTQDYLQADAEERETMEQQAADELHQQRVDAGEAAIVKFPEAYYDSMEEFISDDLDQDTSQKKPSGAKDVSSEESDLEVFENDEDAEGPAATEQELEDTATIARKMAKAESEFKSDANLTNILEGQYEKAKERYDQNPSSKYKKRMDDAEAALKEFKNRY